MPSRSVQFPADPVRPAPPNAPALGPALGLALALGLGILLSAAATARSEEAPPPRSEIVAHPSQLVFPELEYVPPDAALSRHVLPSGVVVFVVEDRELPLVDVQVIARCGAWLDPPGRAGLAGLVTSQIRAGGTAKTAPEDLDEELDFLAAIVGTSLDEVAARASLNCLSKDLDRALDLFLDMLRTPRFDPDRLALKKSQVIQDMARRNDDTDGIESREWARLLRGRDHHTFDATTKGSIEAIVREDLVAFHRKYWHPGNFVFAVSGDVEAGRILDRLARECDGWPGDASERVPAPTPPAPRHEVVPGVHLVDKPDVNQGRVSMGHPSTTRDTPDLHALVAMNLILGGGGFTSRIMSTVRSDKGLAYSAGSRFELGVYYPGDFRAFFQSKSESVKEAAATVLAEIERMRAETVSADELATAVNYAIGLLPRSFATARTAAGTFAMDEFTGRPTDFWTTYRRHLEAITPEDVLRVSKAHLHPQGLVVLIVGNAKEILAAEAGQEALETLAGVDGIRWVPLPDPLTLEVPASPR